MDHVDGLATDWTLSIEEDVVHDRAVDLTGLIAIRVALQFEAKRV